MSMVVTDLTNCLNCGESLHGAYCAVCGQKVTAPRPTFHDLVHEITHEFLHVDAKILQSLKLLFTQPGFLTAEYWEGRRARYITPVRLYLIFSVAFFAVTALTAKPPIVTAEDRQHTTGVRLQKPEEFGRLRVSGDFGKLSPEAVAEIVEHAEHTWMPRIMFVLMPMAALLVAMVTRGAHRVYLEHLYFALHGHAALFGFLTIAVLVGAAGNGAFALAMNGAAVIAAVAYLCVALRRVYGGGWGRALARTAFVASIYLVLSTASFIALLIVAIAVASR